MPVVAASRGPLGQARTAGLAGFVEHGGRVHRLASFSALGERWPLDAESRRLDGLAENG